MGSDDPEFVAWVISQEVAIRVIHNKVFPFVWLLSLLGIVAPTCLITGKQDNFLELVFESGALRYKRLWDNSSGYRTTLFVILAAPLISMVYIILANTLIPIVYQLTCGRIRQKIYQRKCDEQKLREEERKTAKRNREEAEREAAREADQKRRLAEQKEEQRTLELWERRKKEWFEQRKKECGGDDYDLVL